MREVTDMTTEDLTTAAMRRRAKPWMVKRPGQLLLHATILLVLILSVGPIYFLINVSLKNPLQYEYSRWTVTFPLRFSNYTAEWSSVDHYLVNTVFVAAVVCAGVLVLSLIGGHVFSRMRFPFREPLYYAIIALLMVPWVLSFIPAYVIYYNLGLINTYWVLIIPGIAGGCVFGIFLTRSFLEGIPEEIYEAARCDGAGTRSLLLQISLPLATPILATLATLILVAQWNSFLWPLVTINDESKQLAAVGLYHLSSGFGSSTTGGFSFDVWGPLFSGYVIVSLPLVILFIFLGRFYVEGLVNSGLKM